MPAIEAVSPLEEIHSSTNGKATKPRRKRRNRKRKKKKPVVSDHEDDTDDDDIDEGGGATFVGAPMTGHNKATKDAMIRIQGSNSNHRKNGNTPSGASNISTPQEILRERLIESDGYEASVIEQAMEEMWDKGMSYDDYDSVIGYLQSVVTCGTTASTASDTIGTVSTRADNEIILDEITATELEEPNNISRTESDSEEEESGEETPVLENTDLDIDTEWEDEKKDEPEDSKVEESLSSETPATQPPTPPSTMTAKLDMVAGFENLTDAIFALTQWVKQAANEEEIELFCRGEKTTALPEVIRRGITSETEDTKRFETAVQPALVRLLMAVLNRCGLDEVDLSIEEEVEERMEIMLKQARKVCLLADQNVDDEETVVGDRVSRFVVSRLALAMDEMKDYEQKHQRKQRAQSIHLGDEGDKSMATLLSQRNTLKDQAANAGSTVQTSLESVFGDDTADGSSSETMNGHSNGHATSSSLEIQSITLSIVDQQTKNRFDEEKARLDTLKSRVRDEGESSETVQNLRESVASLETKRAGYQEKIAELRAALAELEAQEEDAANQIETLSARIDEEERNDDAQAQKLELDISEAKESIKYGNLVSGLAGMMKTYGKSIEKAIQSKKSGGELPIPKTSNHKQEDQKATEPITKASASSDMEDYLTKVRNYFLMESKCATQLRSRLATTTSVLSALRSELSQYASAKGIGAMSTITGQIEESITQKESAIEADTDRIATLTNDGTSMYHELLERLETYQANATETAVTDDESGSDTDALAALFPTELLRDVPAAIKSLNIDPDCQRLSSFVKERAASESTAIEKDGKVETETTGSISNHAENSAAHDEEPADQQPAPVPTPVAPTYVAPKLVWASSGAQKAAASKTRLSLVDIQNEELRSRKGESGENTGE